MAPRGVRVPVIRGAGHHYSIEGLEEVLRDLKAIADNGVDASEIHMAVAMIVRNWQIRHFDKAEDSKGVAWPALSGLTQALRRGGNAKPLQDSGQTKASIHVMHTNREGWTVGTRKPFASLHQTGRTRDGRTVITPKRGKFLFIGVNSRGGRAQSLQSSLVMGGKRGQRYGVLNSKGRGMRRGFAIRQARIVKREFLYLNLLEQKELVDIYASELASRDTTYINWSGLRRARA